VFRKVNTFWTYQRRKQIREAERERKKERAAQAEAAEKRGDTAGKWPRWTQN
jgi:hypothetical protein